MKKQIITLFTLLTVMSLGAAELQNIPTEIYQEIVANADTLADSAAVFSKLSQTSKALKQQLDAALPAIVEQLARKHSVDKDVASLYFGIDQAKKLNPGVFKNTEKLSKLLEEIAARERDPIVLNKMVAVLTKAGAHFTLYQTRIIDDKHMQLFRDFMYWADENESIEDVEGYENSQLHNFVTNLGRNGCLKDVNVLQTNNGPVLRFLVKNNCSISEKSDYYIIDTGRDFKIISNKKFNLPKIGVDSFFSALVTSSDGARSSIILADGSEIYIVSLDGPFGSITAKIKKDENNHKISKLPWQK